MRIFEYAKEKSFFKFNSYPPLALLAIACTQNNYAELDRILDRHEEIEAAVERKTDSLRRRFEMAPTAELRWECAEDLYKEYRHLNLDSCARYTHMMLLYNEGDSSRILRSKAALVRTLVRAENIQEADSVFRSIDLPPHASSADCEAYFYCADRLTNQMAPLHGRSELAPLVEQLSREYMRRDSSSVKAKLLKVKALRYAGEQQQAITYALSINPGEITDIYDVSSYYMALTSLYLEMNEREKALGNATKSACVDLGCGMNDYFSLYILGHMLFNGRDKQRAARYMNRAVQDALAYNYPVGVRRSARGLAMMYDAISTMNRNRRILLTVAISVVSVLLALSLMFLYINRVMLHRVRRVNNMYKASQRELKNVSLIKDKMLGEYMALSSEYIYKVDESRSRYRKTLKEKGPDALMAVFREPAFADGEFPHYWSNFDKIFLNIFPDFVEKVNTLMLPEQAFVTEGPVSLTTQLRILALIRLGITESKRISVILHISKGSVYTYRCVMRQNSKDPEHFEENIRKIEDI